MIRLVQLLQELHYPSARLQILSTRQKQVLLRRLSRTRNGIRYQPTLISVLIFQVLVCSPLRIPEIILLLRTLRWGSSLSPIQ